MDSDNIVSTPNSRTTKQPKELASLDQQNNKKNNRRVLNNKGVRNKNLNFHNGLFCCNSANTSMFSSITSPGVRRLTVFPDELINNNSCNTKVGNFTSNNFEDMLNNVNNQLGLINLTSMGRNSNGNTLMDFAMPQSQDSSFIPPLTYGWHLKNNLNNLMMHLGQCMCCNHQQNFMHQQLQNHSNRRGMFSSSNNGFPVSNSQNLMGQFMNGGGGDNCNILPNQFNNNKCIATRTLFENQPTHIGGVFTNLGFCNGVYVMTHKIYIPHHSSYNFIGRILGPRGNSVRRLEALTGCKILIRGKGSIKDTNQELQMRNTPGWEHLHEDLHVFITAEDINEQMTQLKLQRAATSIQRLLTPQFDEYKRQQLIQLSIINGTYRP